MKTQIFLADDHQLVRQGVRMLLEAEADFDVVGEAGTGVAAVREVRLIRPEVLVVDMVLPDINGVEVTRETMRRAPEIKVVVLSMYDNEAYIHQAFEAGAAAYVLKSSTSVHLVQAIREIMEGRRYLSPPLSFESLNLYIERLKGNELLTERERQVLQMAARGMNNPEIARRLVLSVRTVEMHRAHIMNKLNLKNQTELVRYTMKKGWVE